MSTTALLQSGIAAIAKAVQAGDVTAAAITAASLARTKAQNPALGAFLSVQEDLAMARATAIDEKRARGEKLGPLAGVPLGIKDALCTTGVPTTSGSRILTRRAAAGEPALDAGRGWKPPYDATCVARLAAADAVFIGKCNMDEFAMGSSNENSAFFPAKNPWDLSRTPGGSSGGSAAAVSASLVAGTLGSDTGGSIRQPAALTGTVGIKPTYGRVSRFGLIAFASSLDQVGPFAQDVRGAARMLSVISGHDTHDATSLNVPVTDSEAAIGAPVKGLRIGVPEEYFGEGLDPEIEKAVRGAIAALKDQGALVVPIRLPHTRYAVSVYYVIATAEASSNLARFDGVRFGLREMPKHDLGTMYRATRDAGFGAEVKRRIMLGTYVLSAGYYDAYYLRAQKVRTLIRRDFEDAFKAVDIIATPVSPTPAFRLGEKISDPLSMYLADIYTLPASLAGLPALSVPCGLTATTNERPALPIGLHLVGPALAEDRLVQAAAAWEAVSPVKNAHPPS